MTNQIVIMKMPHHILIIATSHETKLLRRFQSYVAHVQSSSGGTRIESNPGPSFKYRRPQTHSSKDT